ncbi:multidrug ABC transporter ATP-binding protein [Microbispora rosea subsp. aerata]|nr:ABC transporter ATP-binding protein [Microbispora rosea]GGO00695.1 multidrug ABC transporter ATP-binding protein [Microbispora rosea subsp. aerata]GIH56859.1 multidrug ABC transporter ATP-binding protein [Microbispora rosea subsp. aerata]GLJ84344.1 multidrug ABC transporter ATP-binding protein [Microbispora rosea subsp. aerata]
MAGGDDRNPVIEVEGLRMAYGDVEVLRGVTLRAERGEVLALLGPNGAGKTTTMEILEGLRRRSGGSVTVLGCDPERADERWRGRIGIVLQSWRDHSRWLTGELVRHMARYHDHPKDPEEVLSDLGLAPLAGREVRTLSGGQRRRLDLALALVGDPELIFLDEPTTGLDPAARRQFHDLIAELSGKGVTVLITTHDLAEAERLANRVAILSGGQIAATGTMSEFAARARTALVRWVEDGDAREREVDDPAGLVVELHARLGGSVPGLEVRRQSLEETYLAVMGAGR